MLRKGVAELMLLVAAGRMHSSTGSGCWRRSWRPARRLCFTKEVALLYGEGSFEPRVFEHLPGVANGLADALSRLDEPGAGVKLPAELSDITPAVVPTRTKRYYRILAT